METGNAVSPLESTRV